MKCIKNIIWWRIYYNLTVFIFYKFKQIPVICFLKFRLDRIQPVICDQGVLLLNTVLTVRAHQANSHQGKGWEQFTDAVIQAINAQDRPIVYMLWGRPAQSKIPMLTNPKHLILKAPHPSPLSAYRGFFGCKHFSQANQFLQDNGVEPIDWQIENCHTTN